MDGFIMMSITQLLVMGVAVVELVEVTEEYKALKLNTSDWESALTRREDPGTLLFTAVVEDTKGKVSVTKSVQSFEFEVVMVRVFLGAVVATRGSVS